MKIDAFHYIQPGTVYRYYTPVYSKQSTLKLTLLFLIGSVFDVVVICLIPRGFQAVPDEEVCELYSGTFHVPLEQHSGFYGKVTGLSVRLCHVWCGTDGMGCVQSVIISSAQTDIVWD